MIIQRSASEEIVKYVREYLDMCGGVGQRGEFDGDYLSQFFGLQAQVIVANMLGVKDGLEGQGFDGGYDIIWNDKKYDVKCEMRSVQFKSRSFGHNVSGSQINYDAEGFIFCSYNRTKGVFDICGQITKGDFLEHADFFPCGSKRLRSDGTQMEVRNKGGMYELKNKYLGDFDEI